ncbi:hypothetical protein ZOD2009_09650 [Haladaptatus paucihalophilus DX253]|uniref:Uncharacterized protein n=1 Tax=Haladaptatus paucihalophilus DX253 TaxID=797209 RepID=E7QT32_HALPU|nr:hypothetical protein ZOD2009_09650 [Haladaptatus paucihalophilus DX253]
MKPMLLMILDKCSKSGDTTDEDLYCSNSHQNYRTNDDGLFDDLIERYEPYFGTDKQYSCYDPNQINPDQKAIT